MMENTRKHLRPCIYTPQGVAIIVEMAQAYLAEIGQDLRSRPIVSTGYTIVSPLHWTKEGLEVYPAVGGFGMPATINSECISGATSPVTLAGTLVLANAEALSGIVINQILEPGRPCIYNLGFSHVMDMRSAEPTTGAPENGLIAAAGAAFARDLNLPSAAWTCSDLGLRGLPERLREGGGGTGPAPGRGQHHLGGREPGIHPGHLPGAGGHR